MAEKVVTKKSFIGGRLVYPGEIVDVDAKGAVLPADSTPIGNLSVEQLRSILANREGADKDAPEVFGGNVADAKDTNTGTQRLEMAPFRPSARGDRPQGIPPGTEEHNNTFVRPASEDAPAAVEVVVGEGAPLGVADDDSAFDHDGDGKAGGAPKGGNKKAADKK